MPLTLYDFQGKLTTAEGDGNFAWNVTTSNSFTEGDLVYFSGSGWALARANSSSTMCDGIIVEASGTEFWVCTMWGQIVTIDNVWSASAGDDLWLSQSTAGDGTTTEPTSGLHQPIGKLISVASKILIFRPGIPRDLG